MSVLRRDRRFVVGVIATIAAVFGTILAPDIAFAATYTVSRNHDADWHFERALDPLCPTTAGVTGSHSFEPGPVGVPNDPNDPESGAPPMETGSLELQVGTNGDSTVMMRNTRFAGRKLSEIEALSYWTYTDVVAPTQGNLLDPPAIWLRLAIDKTPTDTTTGEDTLVFEPRFQETEGQDEVDRDRWQHWIADATTGPRGKWWLGTSGSGTRKSLDDWIGTSGVGDAAIVNPAGQGGVILGAGCGDDWTAFVGNTDAFRIDFTTETETVFDMEAPTPGEATELNCEVEVQRLKSGQSSTITCTATSSDTDTPVADVQIDVEATGANDRSSASNPAGDSPHAPDYSCPGTNSSGTCTIPIPSADTGSAGTTTYMAWIDSEPADPATVEADRAEGQNENADPGDRHPEPDDTDVVEKIWVATRLDCEPESVSVPLGGTHTITCTAAGASGAPAANQPVDVEVSGANDPETIPGTTNTTPDISCVTDSNGRCPITHAPTTTRPNTTSGQTTYRGWIDFDNSNTTSEADTAEGVNAQATPGTRAEVDETDVVEANWGGQESTQSPEPSESPCPTPSAGSPSPSPSPSATPCPSPDPTQSASPTPTPTPTPTVEPHGCAGDPDAITGTSGNDILIGTSGDDTICGFGGNDTIRGRGGDDILLGGGGDDSIRGGGGNDVLKGGRGSDVLGGGAGNDRLSGGPGNDVLEGGGGNDRLGGGKGRDQLDGGRARDRCNGGPGRDHLRNCE